jgi:hypothetical protein
MSVSRALSVVGHYASRVFCLPAEGRQNSEVVEAERRWAAEAAEAEARQSIPGQHPVAGLVQPAAAAAPAVLQRSIADSIGRIWKTSLDVSEYCLEMQQLSPALAPRVHQKETHAA